MRTGPLTHLGVLLELLQQLLAHPRRQPDALAHLGSLLQVDVLEHTLAQLRFAAHVASLRPCVRPAARGAQQRPPQLRTLRSNVSWISLDV